MGTKINIMVNKVILIGNVGADPDVKYIDGSEGSVAVANISLATSENYTKNGEKVEQTEWHRIVLWRKLAEVAEKYVKKGMKLYIEGSLRTKTWDDKDGNKRYTTEVWARNMQMLTRSDNSGTTSNQQSSITNRGTATKTTTSVETPQTQTLDNDENDLPF